MLQSGPLIATRFHLMPSASTDIDATLAQLNAQVLVRGWLSANNIVFSHCGAGQVVDTGYVSHADQTLALIERALAGATLHAVVNTHLHSDHCGGNAALAARWPQSTLRVPEASRSKLLPWDDDQLSYRLTGQQCARFTPQHFMADGDTVDLGGRPWQVHAAPGHDPDAVLLFEPHTRTLISGDALWETRLAIIFPELADQPAFDDVAAVLDRIEQLRPALVLPGHGQPFTNVAAALDASRARLAAFCAAPLKHRGHAARALIVFHMLEHRQRPEAALVDWIATTPVFLLALQCTDEPVRARQAAREMVDRLLADAVLLRRGSGADAVVRVADGS
jgi:glyoxylase-like metal-dependent hydrolase (beta-lactamase superfamily II)